MTHRLCIGLAVGALLWAGCTLGKRTNAVGHDQRWSALSHDEKSALMYEHVEPQLRTAFQAFDREEFADFGCATCHAGGAADGTYAMPSPDLPHLTEKGFFKAARKAHPKTVKFMWKEVESSVGKLLGKTYGPKGEFECSSCHVIDDRVE
ncbi:MAG: hypothetical protein AAF721_02445 [Myxococcota bacterium]